MQEWEYKWCFVRLVETHHVDQLGPSCVPVLLWA